MRLFSIYKIVRRLISILGKKNMGALYWVMTVLGKAVAPGESIIEDLHTLGVSKLTPFKIEMDHKLFCRQVKCQLEHYAHDMVSEINNIENMDLSAKEKESKYTRNIERIISEFKWKYQDVIFTINGKLIPAEGLILNTLYDVRVLIQSAIESNKFNPGQGLQVYFKF